MKLIAKTLVVCIWVCLANCAPAPAEDNPDEATAPLDRCEGLAFDAITPDEKGNYFFFHGTHLWKGFDGPAQRSSDFFHDLGSIHVDAAFRMHNKDDPKSHDHIFFFQGDKVLSYYNHTLEDGYPKELQEDFPGIPSHLDAAVECPTGECRTDSVLFFKENQVHIYDITTKAVKTKTWSHLPRCTSALRWLEHHYCFHGHNFTRFHPLSGDVTGAYPKDTRRYFMKCPDFSHGVGYSTPKCSEVKLDAITMDDSGKSYFFAGSIYMRLDSRRDGLHALPIRRMWREVPSVDAVFSYGDKMYFIKGNQTYIYKGGAHYTLMEGYPKSLAEELGIEDHVDAAFLCPNKHTVHIIQGDRVRAVDLTATPRVVTQEHRLPLKDIDAALCGPNGIQLFKGCNYYKYESELTFATSRIAPVPLKITSAIMGCQD
ncbi:hemopexin [Synchiropus picturatus]